MNCEFCKGDLDKPALAGCLSPVMHGNHVYVPSFDAESEAFEGLADETLAAILNTVTPEQTHAFVSKLTTEPIHADALLPLMQQEPWWNSNAKRDTQLRRLRTLRDAANARGYPVCSTNAGYSLDWDALDKTARRARRFAHGADLRATMLERLARRKKPAA